MCGDLQITMQMYISNTNSIAILYVLSYFNHYVF